MHFPYISAKQFLRMCSIRLGFSFDAWSGDILLGRTESGIEARHKFVLALKLIKALENCDDML